MDKLNRLSPGWLLSLIVFLALLLPPLFQEGVFIDGLFYGTLARNLAEGQGSFWAPQFSQTYEAVCFGHPPLAFGLESLLFRLLGDHFWVERLFSFLMALASAWILVKLWQELAPEHKSQAWLVLLGWIIIPRVFWSYSNNMLENPLTLWTLGAIYCVIRSFQPRAKGFFWALGAGGLVGLAVLTKGPVGFFPLVAPALYGICMRENWKKWLPLNAALCLSLGILLGGLLLLEPVTLFWEAYFNKQIVRSLNGELSTLEDWSRLAILRRLGEELAASLVLAGLVYLGGSRMGFLRIDWKEGKALFVLGVGISASAPLFISSKLHDFYLVPAFPYFVLLWNLWIRKTWAQRPKQYFAWAPWFRITLLLVLFGVIAVSVSGWGQIHRDKDLLADIHLLGGVIPEHSIVGISPDLRQEWAFRLYQTRIYHISQDPDTVGIHPYWIGRSHVPAPEGYQSMELELKQFELFSRQ
jgi:4-amino-4-deoxy-L-arabinose transferase-like glycosyltransferase